MGVLTWAAAAVVATAAVAVGAEPTPGGAASRAYDESVGGMVILDPSQGHPLMLAPGDRFYFMMQVPEGLTGEVPVSLQHALVPRLRYEVPMHTALSRAGGRAASAVLVVPPTVVPGVYDLVLDSSVGQFRSRRSVRVVDAFKRRFRFVHLSDMNVGDLTAPEFDWNLPAEINVLNPEFIVATGDFVQWGREQDDPSGWRRVLDYLAMFHAPVFVLCGEHDHEASFTRMVASSLVGTIDYGDYHGVLLHDHFANRIGQDDDQLRWLTADLEDHRNTVFNFIVTHNDELDLLDFWRRQGDPAEMVKQYKLKMIICGGHVDWDEREFAEKLKGFDGLQYIRTHQASTCMRDKATGTSHYRVIEVDGEDVHYVYPDDLAAKPAEHSIPSGRLRVFTSTVDARGAIVGRAANDGKEPGVMATVQNGLNQAFEDCRVWLRVAKAGRAQPVVGGGRLVRALDGGDHWLCEIALDLSDKSAVRVLATTSNPLPASSPLHVSLSGADALTFALRETRFGVRYYGSEQSVSLQLTNPSKEPVSCRPVVRLNGTQLQVDLDAVEGRWPVVVPAEGTLTLPVHLTLGQVSPGLHQVQVYFLDDPLARLTTFPVTLKRQ